MLQKYQFRKQLVEYGHLLQVLHGMSFSHQGRNPWLYFVPRQTGIITAGIDTKRLKGRSMMKKKWQRPVIDERETGLEVTSYMPAELDRK
jgi:coenzyme PQQ precursor peptide PqqA